MEGRRVIQLLDALESKDVRGCVTGGWGVSALAGARLRRHHDLDLVIRAADETRALAALAELGYRVAYRQTVDRPLSARIVLRDHEVYGHTVDLHPVDERAYATLDLSTGSVAGRQVFCLAAPALLAQHRGYRLRIQDRRDVRVLRRQLAGAGTALIVPVLSAQDLVGETARVRGMPPHITVVLYPFVPDNKLSAEMVRALEPILRTHSAFDYKLTRVDRFQGVVYLTPEPAAPFRALTEAVVAQWPAYPPYRRDHDPAAPHLTIAYGVEPEESIVDKLPLLARASEVWLMARTRGQWRRRARVSLGLEG